MARFFSVLGLTSFGGPTAHLGYFHKAFVERKQWLSERAYTDFVAVCQFLPGPASLQVSTALGYHRAGWRDMALSWLLFTLASCLGAVDGGWLGAPLWATIMIFLPSALLIIAGLHFWGRWRTNDSLRAAFTSINAAVVGILLAALWTPVVSHGITGLASLCIAAVAWLELHWWQVPPWAVAIAGALAGCAVL